MAAHNFQLASGSVPPVNAGINVDAVRSWETNAGPFYAYGPPFNKDANGVTRPQGSAWDTGACEWFSGAGVCPNFQPAPTQPPKSPPSIVITTPSATGIYVQAGATINLTGTTAIGSSAISNISWTNDRGGSCTSGCITGTFPNWTILNIPLVDNRVNHITVTVTDADSLTSSAIIDVGRQTDALVLALAFA